MKIRIEINTAETEIIEKIASKIAGRTIKIAGAIQHYKFGVEETQRNDDGVSINGEICTDFIRDFTKCFDEFFDLIKGFTMGFKSLVKLWSNNFKKWDHTQMENAIDHLNNADGEDNLFNWRAIVAFQTSETETKAFKVNSLKELIDTLKENNGDHLFAINPQLIMDDINCPTTRTKDGIRVFKNDDMEAIRLLSEATGESFGIVQ